MMKRRVCMLLYVEEKKVSETEMVGFTFNGNIKQARSRFKKWHAFQSDMWPSLTQICSFDDH